MVSVTTSYNALWMLQQVVNYYTLKIFNTLLKVTVQKSDLSLLQKEFSQMISNSAIYCAYKVCNMLSFQKIWLSYHKFESLKRGNFELLVGE